MPGRAGEQFTVLKSCGVFARPRVSPPVRALQFSGSVVARHFSFDREISIVIPAIALVGRALEITRPQRPEARLCSVEGRISSIRSL